MHTAKHTTLMCLRSTFCIQSGFRTLVLLSSWSPRRAGLIFHPILYTAKKGEKTLGILIYNYHKGSHTRPLWFFENSVHDVSDSDLSGLRQPSGPQADLLSQGGWWGLKRVPALPEISLIPRKVLLPYVLPAIAFSSCQSVELLCYPEYPCPWLLLALCAFKPEQM